MEEYDPPRGNRAPDNQTHALELLVLNDVSICGESFKREKEIMSVL